MHWSFVELRSLIPSLVLNGVKLLRGNRVFSGKKKDLRIPPHRHRLGHFYSALEKETLGCGQSEYSLKVLEEYNFGGVPLSACNKFEDFPELDRIRKMFIQLNLLVGAGAYHESVEVCTQMVTAFYGHYDKVAFGISPVVFLPVQGSCTVFVATPISSHTSQQKASWNDKARSVLRKLMPSPEDRRALMEFEINFCKEGLIPGKTELTMYTLKPGQFLSFNASILYHAVLIHPHPTMKRILLVLHHLELLKQTGWL